MFKRPALSPLSSAPKTSLIISTYNWPEALHCCLLSVARQEVLPDEVIVADDGSTRDTGALIESLENGFPVPLKHIWHQDEGFRKARILNKAVGSSTGEYIIQIDGDVILNAYFIKDHLAAAEKGAFIRGTRAMLTPARTTEVLSSKETGIHAFSGGVYHRLNGIRLPILRFLGQRREMNSRSVRGSNMAFWKSDFILVNGYNNELQGWGHEDEELAARFINNEIIKKIIKLSAVQFHLYHLERPRDNEPSHAALLRNVCLNNIKTCPNGYNPHTL